MIETRRSESWGTAMMRAIPIALWIIAFGVVTIVGTYEWGRWRDLVIHCEADLDPSLNGPDPREDAPRIAEAQKDLKDAKRELWVHVGPCAALAAGLLGVVVLYRRRVPPHERPSRRSWLLAIPIILLFGVIGLLWLATGLSAIKG